MTTLLQVVLAFAGIMLILALAAQSLQEILKAMFAIKHQAARQALESLIMESTRAERGIATTGRDIVNQVVTRLQRLGQDGVRKQALRLDELKPAQLYDLVLNVDPAKVTGLSGMSDDEAKKQLQAIADRTKDWYDLSARPVKHRYRRRMRVHVLASSAVVVLLINANAIDIFSLATNDEAFRTGVIEITENLSTAYGESQRLARALDSARTDTTAAADTTVLAASVDSARSEIDSLTQALMTSETSVLAGLGGERRWGEFEWWIGIVISILFVSMGAPFWHDVLETVFGLKKRATGIRDDEPEQAADG